MLINYRIRLECTLNNLVLIHNEKIRKFHMKYYIFFPINWDVHSCFKQQHTTILLTGHKNPCIINLTIHYFWIWCHTNASLSLPYKNRFWSKQLYLFLSGRPFHFRDKWKLSKTIRISKTNEIFIFGIYLKYTQVHSGRRHFHKFIPATDYSKAFHLLHCLKVYLRSMLAPPIGIFNVDLTMKPQNQEVLNLKSTFTFATNQHSHFTWADVVLVEILLHF